MSMPDHPIPPKSCLFCKYWQYRGDDVGLCSSSSSDNRGHLTDMEDSCKWQEKAADSRALVDPPRSTY